MTQDIILKNNFEMKKKIHFSSFHLLCFLFQLGGFGISGFWLAYKYTHIHFSLAIMHGFIAIFVYIILYINIFGIGVDAAKWIMINTIFGIAQTYKIINFIGDFLIDDFVFENYLFYRHIIPGIYVILCMFLIRQIINQIFRNNDIIVFFVFLCCNIMYWFFG